MRILAIDPSTKTGWAVLARGWTRPESGVQVFDLRRGESPGMRFIRFRAWLESMAQWEPELYVYEQAHHRGGAATELCVGFTTRIIEEAARRGAQHAGVHTGTLKKFATGRGNAEKDAMIEAARHRWAIEPQDDNEADALELLAWAINEYGGKT